MKDIKKNYNQKNILLVLISTIFTFCSSPTEWESSNITELKQEKQLEIITYEELRN